MTPESRLKKEIKAYLTKLNAYWSMVAGGTYAKPGDPDIIACVRGKFIGIEAKTYEGAQSEWQKLRQCQIEDSGGIYVVARSVEDVKKAIRSIGEEYGIDNEDQIEESISRL